MKIVFTIEEVKNMVCEFVHKSQGGEKPKEVVFVHRYSDGSGEGEVDDITPVDRVEVRY